MGTTMTQKPFTVTVLLLVLKFDISFCNNVSIEFPDTNATVLNSDLSISEYTLHVCKDLTDSENFFINCDDEEVSELNSITKRKCWIPPSHLTSENELFKFPISTKDLPFTCESSTDIIEIPLILGDSLENGTKFIRNGYFERRKEFYHMDEYCLNGFSENGSSLELKICKPKCGEGRLCIPKCCPLDKVYSFGFSPNPENKPDLRKGCLKKGDEIFMPTIYRDSRNPLAENELNNFPGLHFMETKPSSFKNTCPEKRLVFFSTPHVVESIKSSANLSFHHLKFRIRKDGKLLYRGPGGTCDVLDPMKHQFCLDGVVNFDMDGQAYKNSEDTVVIFMCAYPKKDVESSVAYGSLMLFSCIFLALTVIVYAMLWDRQTVHGWTIVTHTVCLCFMYVFVGTGHLLRSFIGVDMHNTFGCVFVGVAAHFFTLATFSWLAVISFDLFFTFRAITPRSGYRTKGWSRYIKYSIVGWGIPIAIVITGLIIDAKRTEDDCLEMLPPAYGDHSCYIQENALGLYLFLPLGIFLILNLLFFCITTTKLYQFRESTKMATKDDTQQQFYRLFVKLFFVMGILWIFEVISWAVSGIGMHWYWVIFDIINILRAVAVFFIFVCKPDIINSLEQKYPRLRPVFAPCKRVLFRKSLQHSQRSHTTDESVGLNSSSIRTKSSMIRLENMDN